MVLEAFDLMSSIYVVKHMSWSNVNPRNHRGDDYSDRHGDDSDRHGDDSDRHGDCKLGAHSTNL